MLVFFSYPRNHGGFIFLPLFVSRCVCVYQYAYVCECAHMYVFTSACVYVCVCVCIRLLARLIDFDVVFAKW